MQLRFNQIAIGQRFQWRGETYVKHNSLIAHHGGSGKQQLIPRSELVELLGEHPAAPAKVAGAPLERATVLGAFDAFHAEALHCIETLGAGVEDSATAKARLAQAREHFLAALDA